MPNSENASQTHPDPRRARRRLRSARTRILLAGALLALLGVGALSGPRSLRRPDAEPHRAMVLVAFGRECEPVVREALQQAERSVDVAIFTFTRKSIAEALIHAASQGARVRMKIDAEQAAFEYTKVLLERMAAAGIRIERITMPEGRHMHHKFAIVDRRQVITGSFNWTRRASLENWENAVLIHSKPIAARFQEQWEQVGSKEEAEAE